MAIVGRRTKEPWEEYPLEVDFAPDLISGETVSGSSFVQAKEYPAGTDATAAVIDGDPTTPTSTKLSQDIKGGESGKEYLIEFRAITSLGNKYGAEWLITVQNTIEEATP